MRFSCQECGCAADVRPEGITRDCKHTGGIVANMTATAYGAAHVETTSTKQQLKKLFLSMFKGV
jgi:hypothetical protein